jgi:hypothetical protein
MAAATARQTSILRIDNFLLVAAAGTPALPVGIPWPTGLKRHQARPAGKEPHPAGSATRTRAPTAPIHPRSVAGDGHPRGLDHQPESHA